MSSGADAPTTVLYDEDCGFCKVSVSLLLRWDRDARLYPVAIQSREGQRLLSALDPAERLASAHLVTPDGDLLSGGEAAPALFGVLPLGRPLAVIAARAMPITVLVYRFLTRLRPRIGWMLSRSCRQRAELSIEERRCGSMPPTLSR
jgi:predicted DCC family thiol-disulfide oxidoreductase YuxK